jgi:hypothetical protein
MVSMDIREAEGIPGVQAFNIENRLRHWVGAA